MISGWSQNAREEQLLEKLAACYLAIIYLETTKQHPVRIKFKIYVTVRKLMHVTPVSAQIPPPFFRPLILNRA